LRRRREQPAVAGQDASLKFEMLFYRLDSVFGPNADRKHAGVLQLAVSARFQGAPLVRAQPERAAGRYVRGHDHGHGAGV